MIKVGTLCLLLAPHRHAGRVCTVTSPLEFGPLTSSFGLQRLWHYSIDIPGVRVPGGPMGGMLFVSWAALPNELVPIAPPGFKEETNDRAPIGAFEFDLTKEKA